MSKEYRVLVMPTGQLYDELFPPQVKKVLESFAEIKANPDSEKPTKERLAELAGDVDAVITSWGSPQFDGDVVAKCPRLKFIGHAAGSIKPIVTDEVFQKGITVSSAAPIIAEYVGEAALLSALAGLRNLVLNDQEMRRGGWKYKSLHIHDSLIRQTVGIVGLGVTGRAFLKLLKPFDCDVYGYDPYVSEETAAELGVKLCDLDELMTKCRVISLHAPKLPATDKMISAQRLAMIQDGALLVNTARGSLIDEEALIAELRTGRFSAVLDTYDKEPLNPESPLRSLPNVTLTPHIAGPAYKRRWEMGLGMVEDCERVLNGQEPVYGFDGGQIKHRA